ncbi:MAG: zinc-binding dehydrogenase [Actinobacteria bacterium]|nr:zinc-binding dehydrogenase [Actinomycetota bacterium]
MEEKFMKAIVHDEYGNADGLELREIDRPEVGDGEVLVKVHAAGVDRGVWHVMTGLPYPIRLAGFGLRAPKNPVLGSDVAGVVEAVGDDVTAFRPGDEVFGVAEGSYAEYAVVAVDKLAAMPVNLSFEQAAVVPTSASTALQALRKGNVRAGQKVLITGASGGVGTFAVQLAKALGAEVTAVCSTSKVGLVRSIGADHVIDYKTADFAAGGDRFDVIIDIGGNATLARLRSVLTPKGKLVITGGETDGRWLGGADRQIRAQVLSLFIGQKLGTFIAAVSAKDLGALKEMIENGRLTPVVDRTYPLSEAPEAILYLDEGNARGKVAIAV